MSRLPAATQQRSPILGDPDRVAALRRTRLLDSPCEESFDRLTRLAVAVLRVPVALVSLVDSERQFFKSAIGLAPPWCDARETPLSHSFCKHVVALKEPLIIDDASRHPLVFDNPAIEELSVRAYAGIPLVTNTGTVLGSFCAIDNQPRAWTAREIANLKDLAACVMSEIELRNRAAEAAEFALKLEIRANERLALLDATSEGLYGLDLDGRCTFINRAGARLIGYSPVEVIGCDMHALVHHSHEDGRPYSKQDCAFAGAMRAGADVNELYETLWRRDGSPFMARISSRRVTLAEECIGILMTFSDVSERMCAERRKAMQHAVSRVLADSPSPASASPRFLQAIGEALGCDCGAAWSPGSDGRLGCKAFWQADPHSSAVFEGATRASSFAKGQGLPGRVWHRASAEWIEELGLAANFERAKVARDQGLISAFAFPVQLESEVLGVYEFFTRTPHVGDDELLHALEIVGSQIGQFIEGKRVEEALLLANRAIASSAVGVTISDARQADFPIVFLNDAFTAITGYTGADALGRNCRFLQGPLTDRRIVDNLRTSLRERKECRVVLLNYRKDGATFWNELTISPVLDPSGEPSHFVGIQKDVTEEKVAEQAVREREYLLQAIFGSISAQVAMLDRNGVIAYVSQSWTRFAEENARDAAAVGVGVNYLDVCDKAAAKSAHAREALAGLKAVMAHALPHFSLEYPCHSPQEERWFEMHVDSMPLEHGGAVVTHINMTQRKLAADALVEATRAAEAANLAKSQFLANMSHELRTPLNAIILYSELLQEECEDLSLPRIVPDLQKIGAAARHLLTLINNVLDVSKVEAGKMELYLETFEIESFLRAISETLLPVISKNRNELRVQCHSHMGTLHSDLVKVRQTLFNLLSNAAKFTREGTIVLRAYREESTATRWVVFEVEDSGIGLSTDQIENLFQPFVQADASTTRRYGGTGLGLHISRRFCQALGGDITVTSILGEGAKFTVRLPDQPQHARDAAWPRAAENGHLGLAALLVDDDPAVRKLLSRLLVKEGFRVYSAADGEEGLRLAIAQRPQLVLLDITLPRMDGWTFMARLKEYPVLADVPIVMITVDEDRKRGFAMGAAEFLLKPIDRRLCASVIAKYRGRKHAPAALLIEDDALTREMLNGLLRAEGWSVAQAENGRAGLEKLSAGPAVDLVLLDLIMPELDGFAFLEKLRELPALQELPVIVMTAKDLTSQDLARLDGTIQALLLKSAPYSGHLLDEIRRVMHVHHSTARIGAQTQPTLSGATHGENSSR